MIQMVSKELIEKIKTGIVKETPVKYESDPEEQKFIESEDVRRDI
jgi:hypothetical protein